MTFFLVSHMASSFHNEICFLGERGPVGEKLEQNGIKTYYLPIKSLWTVPRIAFCLYRLLRANHYDILHLYGFRANFLGRILSRPSGHKKVLGALRSKYPSDTDIKKSWIIWIDRLTFGLCFGYVSNSQAAIEFLTAHGYNPRKFWLIHNGINIEPFRGRDEKEKAKIKWQYGLSLDKPVITCIANFRPAKGQEFLIRALHELKDEVEDFIMLMIGDGPLRSKLELLVRKLDLNENVRFLGSKDWNEIPIILAITEIFVLPALAEGISNAIMEAMATGCSIVATTEGGNPELIVDGETGFLVKPRDPKALSQSILQLLKNPQLREKMGKATIKKIKKNFSLDKMVRSYENLYKRLSN